MSNTQEIDEIVSDLILDLTSEVGWQEVQAGVKAGLAIRDWHNKQIEQAYSDGFQKASKGAFKSQQAAKREAVEEVLDRLESKLVERRVDNTPYAPGKEYLVPEAAIEAERKQLSPNIKVLTIDEMPKYPPGLYGGE